MSACVSRSTHALRNKLTNRSSCVETSTPDFVSFFWEKTLALIPQSVMYPCNARQLFDIALVIFSSIPHGSHDSVQLASYTRNWGDLLLSHVHDEVCQSIILRPGVIDTYIVRWSG